jgi:hypothetical protein
MDFTKKIMPIRTVFTQMLDDELIILDTQSENYFALDSIGMQMWEQLSKHHSPQILYEYMLVHYEVEASILKKDIEIFIQNLLTHQLITGEI